MSTRKYIEQERANKAYNFAQEINKKQKDKDAYRSHVDKVPAMIRINGLGNTLLYMKTGDELWKKLYQQIGKWLNNSGFLEENEDVLESILKLDEKNLDVQLRAMTQETLALLNWLRRFAKN